MSFGFSPSDVVKLVEVSTRVYLAFKDANENSEAQVGGLVREFTAFHQCSIELDELMREYGKPLPFPFDDFKDTIERCEKSIKPYAENLVDRKMNLSKMVYTIKYMGKEKEIDGLRKQISGHYQALQMCISFLQLRLHLESTKQTQRLLDTAPFRSMSLGGQLYTLNAFASSSRADLRALPAADDANGLYQEWLVFSRWLKSEDERLAQEAVLTRPLSLGDTPAAVPSGDPQTAAALYRLRRELEDAIVIEENRAKRAAIEKRTHLAPSDAVRQEVKSLPPAPMRTYTLDSEFSGIFSRFVTASVPNTSVSTPLRSIDNAPSPKVSPKGGWQNQSYFENASTDSDSQSAISQTSAHPALLSPAMAPKTTPEPSSRLSIASLAMIDLGDSALDWKPLCRKVQVERKPHSGPPESRECDIHWRYNEDAGIAIRSAYRYSEKVKVWTVQAFPATGPSIPLTTAYPDGDVSIDFPRGSCGRLDKRYTDIKYTFANQETSSKLQTLLYTDNGIEAAELLFDRCVLRVSSNLNKPECRGKNIRLWRKSEEHNDKVVDVLVLLFYTSALPDEQAHWVEEPHYTFQWLTEDACAKSSDRLTLVFSKEPGKWNRDKLFQRRKSSSASLSSDADTSPASRRDSGQSARSPPASPGITTLFRRDTQSSIVSTTSNLTTQSMFGQRTGCKRVGDLNRFGYNELEIKFKSKSDRNDFVVLWQQHVKQLVSLPAKGQCAYASTAYIRSLDDNSLGEVWS